MCRSNGVENYRFFFHCGTKYSLGVLVYSKTRLFIPSHLVCNIHLPVVVQASTAKSEIMIILIKNMSIVQCNIFSNELLFMSSSRSFKYELCTYYLVMQAIPNLSMNIKREWNKDLKIHDQPTT